MRVVLACVLAASVARADANANANVNVNASANVNVNDEPPPRPLAKKPMFWVALIGGVAVIAAGVSIAFILNPPRDPAPTWGVGVGN